MDESARRRERPDRFARTILLWPGLVLVLLGAPTLLAASSSNTLDLSASFRFDDNHSDSIDRRDREGDEVLRLEAFLLRPPVRGTEHGVIFDAALGLEKFGDLEALDRLDLSVGAALVLLAGSGYASPSLDVGLRGEIMRHRDSEVRDGARLTLFARSALRVTDRLSTAVGVEYAHRTATDGAVFDTRIAGLRARAELSFSGQQLLWIEARGTAGDLTANVAGSGARLRRVAEALEVDAAFGPGLPLPGPAPWPGSAFADRLAYRLDGVSASFEAGWIRALGARSTVEASIGHRSARADGRIRYDNFTAAIFLTRRLR